MSSLVKPASLHICLTSNGPSLDPAERGFFTRLDTLFRDLAPGIVGSELTIHETCWDVQGETGDRKQLNELINQLCQRPGEKDIVIVSPENTGEYSRDDKTVITQSQAHLTSIAASMQETRSAGTVTKPRSLYAVLMTPKLTRGIDFYITTKINLIEHNIGAFLSKTLFENIPRITRDIGAEIEHFIRNLLLKIKYDSLETPGGKRLMENDFTPVVTDATRSAQQDKAFHAVDQHTLSPLDSYNDNLAKMIGLPQLNKFWPSTQDAQNLAKALDKASPNNVLAHLNPFEKARVVALSLCLAKGGGNTCQLVRDAARFNLMLSRLSATTETGCDRQIVDQENPSLNGTSTDLIKFMQKESIEAHTAYDLIRSYYGGFKPIKEHTTLILEDDRKKYMKMQNTKRDDQFALLDKPRPQAKANLLLSALMIIKANDQTGDPVNGQTLPDWLVSNLDKLIERLKTKVKN